MIKSAIHDVKIAISVFKDLRKARRKGGEIVVERNRQIPVIVSGGFYNTVEECALSWLDRDILDKASEVFNGLSDGEKHKLQFSPRDGEFIERVTFWKNILKPVMTKKQCNIAMSCIIERYIHIKKMQKGGAE